MGGPQGHRADRARLRRRSQLTLPDRVWRVGYSGDPLNPPPASLYAWKNRFDDPQQRYRTIYCSEHRATAFREVLQDFRPDAKTKAEFAALFRRSRDLNVAGTVRWAWREENVLAPATLNLNGPLVDLDDPVLIQELENELAPLLARHGIDHLDISTLRSHHREITQHISRMLYDNDAAGLRFASNTDNQSCYVVFEDRGTLVLDGTPEPCTDDIPELLQVCSEYELVLRRRGLLSRLNPLP